MALLNIRKATIVVVHHDEAWGGNLAQSLCRAGYTKVTPYVSAKDGIVEIQGGKVDALVIDWEITDIPAPTVVCALRANKKKMPILVISSVAESREAALEAGASAVVCQPGDNDKIVKTLDQLMLAKLGIASPVLTTD